MRLLYRTLIPIVDCGSTPTLMHSLTLKLHKSNQCYNQKQIETYGFTHLCDVSSPIPVVRHVTHTKLNFSMLETMGMSIMVPVSARTRYGTGSLLNSQSQPKFRQRRNIYRQPNEEKRSYNQQHHLTPPSLVI